MRHARCQYYSSGITSALGTLYASFFFLCVAVRLQTTTPTPATKPTLGQLCGKRADAVKLRCKLKQIPNNVRTRNGGGGRWGHNTSPTSPPPSASGRPSALPHSPHTHTNTLNHRTPPSHNRSGRSIQPAQCMSYGRAEIIMVFVALFTVCRPRRTPQQ